MNSTRHHHNKTFEMDDLLTFYNDKMFILHTPAIVYVSVLMVLRLIGNTMVIYFYGIKCKSSTTSWFITILALYDIFVCCICMPTEIADLSLYYMFSSNLFCKLFRLVTYTSALGSALTLIVIAADRYYKICRPFKNQMTLHFAKKATLGVVCISLLISAPTIILYGATIVDIPNEHGVKLTGFDCTMIKEKRYLKYVWSLVVFYFVIIALLCVIIVSVYTKLGVCIHRQKKRMTNHKTICHHSFYKKNVSKFEKEPKEIISSQKSVSLNNIHHLVIDTNLTDTAHDRNASVESLTKVNEGALTKNILQNNKNTTSSVSDKARRVTLIMAIVSAVFVFSFVPYLIAIGWRLTTGAHETKSISGWELVAYRIGTMSYLVNSALNPWIYGIFNNKFREHFFVGPYRGVRKCLCRLP